MKTSTVLLAAFAMVLFPTLNFASQGPHQTTAEEAQLLRGYEASFRGLANDDQAPWALAAHFNQIVFSYHASGNPAFLELAVDQGNELASFTAEAQGRLDEIGLQSAPVLTSKRYSCGRDAAVLVHHAAIWAPIMEAATRLQKDHLSLLREKPEVAKRMMVVFRVSMLGLNYFDKDVKRTSEGLAYVQPAAPFPCDDLRPDFDGKAIPLNMAAAAGSLALQLTEFLNTLPEHLLSAYPSVRAGQAAYQQRQLRNLSYATSSVLPHLRTEKGALLWSYMPGGRPEDITHGALVVDFLLALERGNRLVEPLSGKLTTTYRNLLFRQPGNVLTVYSHVGPYVSRGVDVRTIGETKSLSGLTGWAPLIRKHCAMAGDILKAGRAVFTGAKLKNLEARVRLYQREGGCPI